MKCKTVKERILECDLDELNNEFFLFFRNEDRLVLLEEHKHSFRKMIDGIKEVLPLKSDNIIIAEYLDCIPGVKLDDNDFDEVSFSVNTKGIDLRMIDVF